MNTEQTTASKFADLGAALVHEASGRLGAVDSAIRPRLLGSRVCGVALPVDCHKGDNLALHRALADSFPGCLLIADGGSAQFGYWGEVMSTAAIAKGVVGMVIDGGVRDTAGMARVGFPTWSRFVSIRGTDKRCAGRIGEEVSVGGVVVRSGDFVIADDDGVMVVEADRAGDVLAAALRQREAEAEMMRRLSEGTVTTLELGKES